MAHEHQYVCDGCGDIVHGKMRGQYYHRDYVQFKGQMVLQQDRDPVTRENRYTYLTYANKLSDDPSRTALGEELTFCVKSGMPCIEKWMDRRRNEIAFHREQKRVENLREIRKSELRGDEIDRTVRGGL